MIPNPGKATPFMIRRLKPLHRVKRSPRGLRNKGGIKPGFAITSHIQNISKSCTDSSIFVIAAFSRV